MSRTLYSNLRLSVDKHQESLKPGAAVTLSALLKEYDVPLSGDATVWAEITRPDQSAFDLKLARESAGSYSASFNSSSPGVYTCRVRAEGLTSMGSPFTREQTVTAGVYYGDYRPVPQSADDDVICHLIECLISEKVLSPEVIRRFAAMGIDLKRFMECVTKTCAGKPKERIPGLINKAFHRRATASEVTTPSVSFRKAAPARALRRPPPPAPKPRPKVETPTMFMPIAEMPPGKPSSRMANRTARNEATCADVLVPRGRFG